MQIRHIKINNFRGIRQMEWSLQTSLACLIGPGDSTKSTILDAIEYALSPRWNIPFEDCDFYLSDTSTPIEIVVTVGQIPDEFLSDQKFGLYIRGWNKIDGVRDEPVDDDELVLSIRLRVDSSLEPEWTVVNDRDVEGHFISSRDRELLGMTRLGAYIDRHLSWGRGSALLQLTEDKTNAAPAITEAHRKAREAANLDEIDEFRKIAEQAKESAAKFGVQPQSNFRPALDPRAINIGIGAVSIHDGDIPVRLIGLGSRRLIAMGLQMSCVEEGSVLLIDEVEHALEPHRIRHLLRLFQQADTDSPSAGQVIMTSHCHTVVLELASNNLYVVRSENGITNVRQVGAALQAVARSVPEALLGRKVVVCEGKTEYGVCRSIEDFWVSELNRLPLAYIGAVLVEGGGSKASQRAFELARLGYSVCLFIDSDTLDELNPDIAKLEATGVRLIYWEGCNAIEQRIALDLPWKALKKILVLAVEIKGEDSVFDKICSVLDTQRASLGTNIDDWLKSGLSEHQIRSAIGLSAKRKGWFKRIDHGQELGKIVAKELPDIQDKDLALKVNQLGDWIYE